MAASSSPRRDDPFAALRLSEYRLLLAARFLASVGLQMEFVAAGWQIYALTHDPLALGFIGLAAAVPSLLVSLYAGHLADVVERKRITLVSLAAFVVSLAGLGFLSFHVAPGATTASHRFLFYALIFLTGLGRGFLEPAVFGLIGEIVPKDLYGNSAAWRSFAWQAAAILGPIVGGLFYGFGGPVLTYWTAGGLVAVGALLFLGLRARPRPPRADRLPVWASVKEGVAFVFNHQIILAAMALDLFAVLFGGAVALLPIFAADILHIGPEGLGLLRAAPAAGALVVSFTLAFRPIRKGAGLKFLWAVAGFGLCMILFGLSRNVVLSVVLLALSGAFDNVSVFFRSTGFQLLTPDRLKGRVAAVDNIFVGSSNEIGEAESGFAARWLGTVEAVVLGGCLTLAVVVVAAWRAPLLRKFDLDPDRPTLEP